MLSQLLVFVVSAGTGSGFIWNVLTSGPDKEHSKFLVVEKTQVISTNELRCVVNPLRAESPFSWERKHSSEVSCKAGQAGFSFKIDCARFTAHPGIPWVATPGLAVTYTGAHTAFTSLSLTGAKGGQYFILVTCDNS